MTLLDAPKWQVGFFVMMALVAIGYMSVKVGENPNVLSGGKRYHFFVDDAGGLIKGSQVKISGIPVGIIKNIALENGKARVDIVVSGDYPISTSSVARIRTQGILGDKYIDIYPGSVTDPPLGDGEVIQKVMAEGSLDQVITKVGQIADDIKEVSKNISEAVTEDGTDRHIVGRVIRNIERLTADLSEIAADNKNEIRQIVKQLNNVTKSLDEVMNSADDGGARVKLKSALTRLDNSLKNIEEITNKLNQGEGTLGKLISDEGAAEVVENTLDSVDAVFGGVSTLMTSLHFQSVYLGEFGAARTQVGVKLEPGPDRHYYLAVVDDPSGLREVVDTKLTQGGVVTETREEKTYLSKTKFSLWFAKTFYDFTIRAGLIESSGGLGIDYSFFRERLLFSLELMEFSKLNIRAQLQARLWRGLYAIAGIQDLAQKGNKNSSYFGISLLISNEDLILLMSRGPSF
ncbi:MAG: MlaD family protein [Bdellovibrionaceae bacterium]|nr:MlaD family protein [Pseudobdellovibrionaceae bacterium]MDW8191190.1 MlaD family protein [Pseudobdellovibrionaceae bacterium]